MGIFLHLKEIGCIVVILYGYLQLMRLVHKTLGFNVIKSS